MKICPKCHTNYADDTLSFCLEDGTPLTWPRLTDMPTAVLNDPEILTRVRSSGAGTGPRFIDSQVTSVGSTSPQPLPQKRATGLTVAVTALGMIVLFGVLGEIGYFVFINAGRPMNTNVEPNKNTGGSPTPAPSVPSASPVATGTVPTPNSTQPSIDLPAIRSEVMKEIFGQKSARDSRDLASYMSYYADTLDRYYNKSGMSRAGVRADKARHFSNYTSMQSDYSNMNITVSPDGQSATAVFDKEWNFSGVKDSSGKVQSQIIFKRIGGRWLITTERDMKVYYTR